MEWYIRIHGTTITGKRASREYCCYDLLEALEMCKAAVQSGFMAELLMEDGN